MGEFCTEFFTFTALSKKKLKPSRDIYYLVFVLFEESVRCYDYLCDDETVKVDDRVIVMGYDWEKAVKVMVEYDKLVLPVKRYKKVLFQV